MAKSLPSSPFQLFGDMILRPSLSMRVSVMNKVVSVRNNALTARVFVIEAVLKRRVEQIGNMFSVARAYDFLDARLEYLA